MASISSFYGGFSVFVLRTMFKSFHVDQIVIEKSSNTCSFHMLGRMRLASLTVKINALSDRFVTVYIIICLWMLFFLWIFYLLHDIHILLYLVGFLFSPSVLIRGFILFMLSKVRKCKDEDEITWKLHFRYIEWMMPANIRKETNWA